MFLIINGAEMLGNVVTIRLSSDRPTIDAAVFAARDALDAKARELFAQDETIIRYRSLAARHAEAQREAERIDQAIKALVDQSDAVRRDLPADAVTQLTKIETQLVPLRQQAESSKSIIASLEPMIKTARAAARRVGETLGMKMHKDELAAVAARKLAALQELARVASLDFDELGEILAGGWAVSDIEATRARLAHVAEQIPAEVKPERTTVSA